MATDPFFEHEEHQLHETILNEMVQDKIAEHDKEVRHFFTKMQKFPKSDTEFEEEFSRLLQRQKNDLKNYILHLPDISKIPEETIAHFIETACENRQHRKKFQ